MTDICQGKIELRKKGKYTIIKIVLIQRTSKEGEFIMKSKYAYRREWYTHMLGSPSDYYFEPFKITGNLYFVGSKDSASHLIDTGDGLILIDTGYPNMGGILLHSIWKCGFSPENIKIILHTHGHFDHFGNTNFLAKISGAKTYLGKEDAVMFEENPRLTLIDYFDGVPTEMFIPDIEINDGDKICLGNTVIEAIHTPGHSQGAYTFRFCVQDQGINYYATLCGGAGFNTLNKTFIEETGLNWRKDFEKSLDIWEGMQTDIYLGNHTPQSNVIKKREVQMKKEKNPFINPGEWKEYIRELKQSYNKMVDEEG